MVETERQTTIQFMQRHGVRVTLHEYPAGTWKPRWTFGARHWRGRITHQGRAMRLDFHTGGAQADPRNLLECVADDSASYENARDLDDFAYEHGYPPTEARRIYRACQRQAASLRRVLGDDLYHELLWETERT